MKGDHLIKLVFLNSDIFLSFLVLVFTKQAMALIFGHYDKWHASIFNCFIVANVGESHSNGIYLEDHGRDCRNQLPVSLTRKLDFSPPQIPSELLLLLLRS